MPPHMISKEGPMKEWRLAAAENQRAIGAQPLIALLVSSAE